MAHPRRVREPNPDKTAPQLVVNLQYEVRVDQHVDLVGYFSDLSATEREWYRQQAKRDWTSYGEEELVLNFLIPDDNMDVGLPFRGEGVSDPAWVDIDDVNFRVRLRQGYDQPTYDRAASEFTRDDLEYLLDHVGWLKAVHLALRKESEEENEADLAREADFARIPGPDDTPLEGL